MKAYIQALRPKQWVKNSLVFAALLFSKELLVGEYVTHAVYAFVLFCLTSSVVYVLNDIRDKDEDVHHPQKRFRPIASGAVSVQNSYIVILFLSTVVVVSSVLLLPKQFFWIVLIYVALNVLYSIRLKRIVIVDILIVSIGFVLRAMAGAVAISVSISPWLLATTFFAALFLILGKRRHELVTLGNNGVNHRAVLNEYSKEMLDALLIIVTTAAIVMYVLYTMAPRTIEIFDTSDLIYTVVFVVYGIFRAYYLIYQKQQGGAPTEMLLSDRPLQISIVLWSIATIGIIYQAGV